MTIATVASRAPHPASQPPGPPPAVLDYATTPDAVPPELLRRSQWVGWCLEWRPDPAGGGSWTKVPINPHTGRRASATRRRTWGSFAQAVAAARRYRLQGIGFVLTEDDDLVFVDLDGCIDPATGEVAAWAAADIRRLDSWTERSPSGTGAHVLLRGALPFTGRNVRPREAYRALRFATWTGRRLPGTPGRIEERREALAAWAAEMFPNKAPDPGRIPATPSTGPWLTDEDVVRRASAAANGEKFRRLWAGDTSGHGGDDSAADEALLCLLHFYTGPDPSRLDRLFRRSGLMRPKWDERRGERTYGQRTLASAIAFCAGGETYTAPRAAGPDGAGAPGAGRTNGAAYGAPPGEPPPGPGGGPADGGPDTPRIDVTVHDLPVVTAQAWRALERANRPEVRLLREGGLPVRVEPDDDGAPVLRELTPDRTRHELARAATFFVVTKSGDKTVEPPTVVVADVLATPAPPLPPVTRLTECPTFAPDGTLETGPGYHPASRTYCTRAIRRLEPVPAAPTAADVARAVRLLDELVADFPFVDQADRANALAFGLQPYVRDLIAGPTPLHLFEAPAPGTGKGLLVEALLRPACGRDYGSFSQCRDDDEWRKRLTSVLLDGYSAVVIDNVTRTLDSGALAVALTATHWSDRLLGRNATVRLPVRCAWAATANNPAYSTELARRTVPTRLDAKVDRPWERTGFRHAHLLAWVDARRAELVWAGLVLAQHWLARGRPAHTGPVLGSYEAWSTVLGGILEAAGVGGFLGNLGRFYDAADTETAAWRGFVAAWWERHRDAAVGAGDLFALATETDHLDLGAGNERSQRTRFGKRLGQQRDRVIGHHRVAEAGKKRHAAQWRLLDTRVPPPEQPPPAPPTPPATPDPSGPGVNVTSDVHPRPQVEEAPPVNVGERFAPRAHAGAGAHTTYGGGGQNVHPRPPRSPDDRPPPFLPAAAPGRSRPVGVWARRGPGLGGGLCEDETHAVFVYVPGEGPSAGKSCHGCAVCWPEHPQASGVAGPRP